MLQIRFNRVGKKNKAYFRIVLQEHTIAPGGKHVTILGSWDPHQKKGVFNGEKINYWIGKGAQVSDSVWNLLIKQGIVKGKKRAIRIKQKTEKLSDEEIEQQKNIETKQQKDIKTEQQNNAGTDKQKNEIVKEETKEETKKEEIKKEEKIEEKKTEKAKPEEKK